MHIIKHTGIYTGYRYRIKYNGSMTKGIDINYPGINIIYILYIIYIISFRYNDRKQKNYIMVTTWKIYPVSSYI